MSPHDDWSGRDLLAGVGPRLFRYLVTLKGGCERGKSTDTPLDVPTALRGEWITFLDGATRVAEIVDIEAVSEADYQTWLSGAPDDLVTGTAVLSDQELRDLIDTIEGIPRRAGRDRTADETMQLIHARGALAARAPAPSPAPAAQPAGGPT